MIPEYRVGEGPPVGVAMQYPRMGDSAVAPGALCRRPAGSPANLLGTNGAG